MLGVFSTMKMGETPAGGWVPFGNASTVAAAPQMGPTSRWSWMCRAAAVFWTAASSAAAVWLMRPIRIGVMRNS